MLTTNPFLREDFKKKQPNKYCSARCVEKKRSQRNARSYPNMRGPTLARARPGKHSGTGLLLELAQWILHLAPGRTLDGAFFCVCEGVLQQWGTVKSENVYSKQNKKSNMWLPEKGRPLTRGWKITESWRLIWGSIDSQQNPSVVIWLCWILSVKCRIWDDLYSKPDGP